MKCERCGVATKGYDLHDYCVWCSKNLCAGCMRDGKCPDSVSGHEASAQMKCSICYALVDDCKCGDRR